ncbi:MAG: spermidine synthase [Syntrophales bacterium]
MGPSAGSGAAGTVLTIHVFLGAFLLFSLEPMTGRLLLPIMGGAIQVWLVCLMFFQGMLLAGYLYAHFWAARAGAGHLLLLLVPLAFLPLSIPPVPEPGTPLESLLRLLLLHVAVPFGVLSSTAVVAQLWLSRSPLGGGTNVFVLYGASNAGSLLGLLAYPFLVEPYLGLAAQGRIWTAGYVLYGLMAAASWFLLRPGPKAPEDKPPAGPVSTPSVSGTGGWIPWLLLSALPSAFLLTVTNVIAVEVGSYPLVWILPLALYLASFVVVFREGSGLPDILVRLWPEILLAAILLYLLTSPHLIYLAAHLAVLFILCLLANSELYRLRPPPAGLTGYYLVIALGGALGGAAVSLGAPLLFGGLYEYPLTVLALGGVLGWLQWRKRTGFRRNSTAAMKILRAAGLGVMAGMILLAVWSVGSFQEKERLRNYYGILRVVEEVPGSDAPRGIRTLIHGSTLHGTQFIDEPRRQRPTLYYGENRGLGDVFAGLPVPRRVAAVGLGAGTVAAYGRPGDRIDFFEIDPDVETVARRWFTYLDDSLARVRVFPGDGRLSLERGGGGEETYDLLFVDAFSGDGIPTHLLTTEAVEAYRKRLSRGGLMLFHLSNRYYDLRPVVKAIAGKLNLKGVVKVAGSDPADGRYRLTTVYVALAAEPGRLVSLAERGWIPFGAEDGIANCRPWTDDYVNVLVPLAAKIRSGLL